MKRPALILAGLLSAPIALACEWDRDTLMRDNKEFPTTIAAIVGRIDVDPPLFYSMRRDRVARELKENPNRTELYDDIAVAESRLGNRGAAIDWMVAKSKLKLTDDERYRMFSNIGTFRFLKWIADPQRPLALIDQAISDIKAGLRINPNAHFGRESTQLKFMEWASAVRRKQTGADLLNYFKPDGEDVRGLTGLLALGEAWESAELVYCFVYSFDTHPNLDRHVSTAAFARWRALELQANRKPQIDPKFDFNWPIVWLDPEYEEFVHDEFLRLRQEADAYRQGRQKYELSRLIEGRHPDTDSNFWSGWHPKPMEVRDRTQARQETSRRRGLVIRLALGAFISLVIALTFAKARRKGRLG